MNAGMADVELARRQLTDELTTHQERLFTRARQLTGDHPGAWELLQDTVVEGLRGLPGFQPGTNMRAWLLRIMFNLHVDHCRRHQLFRRLPRLVLVPAPPAEPDVTPEFAPSPEQVREAVGRLAAGDREI